MEDKHDYKPEDSVCGGCSLIQSQGVHNCQIHGKEFIEWKCRYCCSMASFFCFGTTHFCDKCHRNVSRLKVIACPGKDKCPLGIEHPPNGAEKNSEYAMGCWKCRIKD